MPERVRQAIASVRRISIEAAEFDDQELEPRGLREAPGRFASADPPEPAAPLDPPRPSLREIREPPAPSDAFQPSAAFDAFAPPPFLDTRAPPPAGTLEPPPLHVPEPEPALDAPEPEPSLDGPEPQPALDGPEPQPALDGPESLAAPDEPGRRPHWRHGEAEPGPGRGIRIAALVMAAAVVLLVGSGLGALLAGWRLELPTLLTGTAATPEPVAESEAPPPSAETPEAPPPIAEVTRVEPAPMPPAPAIGPSAPAVLDRMPLPPPPKPAPSSGVAAEGPGTTDDAIEDALDALLRETGGTGGPLEPLDGEEASLAPIRVFVHYAASVAGEQATAMHLARRLEAEGFAVEAREVEFPIDLDSIRYFFPADRDDAEALSASLKGQVPGGAAPPVLDFTDYEPKPSPGYLELWIGP